MGLRHGTVHDIANGTAQGQTHWQYGMAFAQPRAFDGMPRVHELSMRRGQVHRIVKCLEVGVLEDR